MNRKEILDVLGLNDIPEIKAEDGTVISKAVSQSTGVNVYEVPLDLVTGIPAEYASTVVTADCYATVSCGVLYIGTKGTCSVGKIVDV